MYEIVAIEFSLENRHFRVDCHKIVWKNWPMSNSVEYVDKAKVEMEAKEWKQIKNTVYLPDGCLGGIHNQLQVVFFFFPLPEALVQIY